MKEKHMECVDEGKHALAGVGRGEGELPKETTFQLIHGGWERINQTARVFQAVGTAFAKALWSVGNNTQATARAAQSEIQAKAKLMTWQRLVCVGL